jgi:hypothetical protein
MVPGVDAIAGALDDPQHADLLSAADGATLLALSGRVSRHLLYHQAIEIATAAQLRSLDSASLQLAGARYLIRLLKLVEPSRTAIANAIAEFRSPRSKQAESWVQHGKDAALARALAELKTAIEKNPRAAQLWGLQASIVADKPKETRDTVFNRAFRRRFLNIRDYASLAAVGAVPGHDTLSREALKHYGHQLIAAAHAGCCKSAVVLLEVVTHLTSEIVLQIPLRSREFETDHLLAWIDIASGRLIMKAFFLQERAATPAPGTEDLYIQTSQLVPIDLTPPLAELLRRRHANAPDATHLVDVLGADSGHVPRSSVLPSGGYMVTSRRMQESLPPALIERGHHRWPVALVTNSHQLVSRGKVSYGACSASSVTAVVADAWRLLGCPTASPFPSVAYPIGTFTVPKPESITRALNHLASEADKVAPTDWHTPEEVRRGLTAHAQWIAALWALTFALRGSVLYSVSAEDLRAGRLATIRDKDVHPIDDLAIPVVRLASITFSAWERLVAGSVIRLSGDANADSVALAKRIVQFTRDSHANAVFTIDPTGLIKDVKRMTPSHSSWQEWASRRIGCSGPSAVRLVGFLRSLASEQGDSVLT